MSTDEGDKALRSLDSSTGLAHKDVETRALEAKAKMRELVLRAEETGDKIRSAASISHHANRRPWVVVGVGLGLGILAGARSRRRRHERDPASERFHEALLDGQEALLRQQREMCRRQEQLHETLQSRDSDLKGAMERHQRALVGALEEMAVEQRRELSSAREPSLTNGHSREPRTEQPAEKEHSWVDGVADVALSAVGGVVRALAARAIYEITGPPDPYNHPDPPEGETHRGSPPYRH